MYSRLAVIACVYLITIPLGFFVSIQIASIFPIVIAPAVISLGSLLSSTKKKQQNKKPNTFTIYYYIQTQKILICETTTTVFIVSTVIMIPLVRRLELMYFRLRFCYNSDAMHYREVNLIKYCCNKNLRSYNIVGKFSLVLCRFFFHSSDCSVMHCTLCK